MLEKNYDSRAHERAIYAMWEEAGCFSAGAGSDDGARPYCIVIPPPNITGSLHIGHALNNTLQDVLVRYQRLKGRDVLWQPGTDHASIAAQLVVERQMAENDEPDRHSIGREAFLKRVWQWKEESGNTIIHQLKRLGASCDWNRTRFTMDEGLSAAVLKVFVSLYRQGLIYKDTRLVNWDPKMLTAISDLEVQQVETDGHLWHFKYPLADDPSQHVIVATTRPETMLGDTAVAVNPDDVRYTKWIGKQLRLPLCDRLIPIVADAHADPEAGTGAVKITPAHDFNDFEVGKRHALPQISVMDKCAHMALKDNVAFFKGLEASGAVNRTVERIEGLDRFAARKQIVEMMDEIGLLSHVEPHRHMVPHGERGKVPVEPRLTEQWYVDAHTLAQPAIAAVREGRTKFVPANWENTYFHWMESIEPWCISRQLWWGHQIPAWYGPDGEIFVASNPKEAVDQACSHYGRKVVVGDEPNSTDDCVTIMQDPDVLDTWFSSALWPFSTLGWPEETQELAKYYQTDVLVTGFDIIFFWVARMMMFGLHFMKEEPFHTVYMHALVRDEHGKKMSKTTGNVIDPLDLIDQFGADALRMTLTAMAAPGRDINMSVARVNGYRNFCTKLWNAARFCQFNGMTIDRKFSPDDAVHALNRWVLNRCAIALENVEEAFAKHRFNDIADAIYHFVWDEFCDWYLELSKPVFKSGVDDVIAECRATMGWVIEGILVALHPIAPFVTEKLWFELGYREANGKMLALHRWPSFALCTADHTEPVNMAIQVVSAVRSVRSELNIAASMKIGLVLVCAGDTEQQLESLAGSIMFAAGANSLRFAKEAPKGAVVVVVHGITVALPLKDVVDVHAELARLTAEREKKRQLAKKHESKLANPNFVDKAPGEIVARQRKLLIQANDELSKVDAALNRLAKIE